MSNFDISSIKTEAERFPEPLKTLILMADQKLPADELIIKFLQWRSIARILDGEGKKNGK